jgi:hypothetical protein
VRTERMNEAELTLIREWVPIYGVRETARALSRDVSGVARHARRMGLQSPLSPQRPHREPETVSASGGLRSATEGVSP